MQLSSWSEPFSVFSRGDEGLYHFCASEIAVEAIELIQPEVVTLKVERRLRRIVRIPLQITEVLHQHERAVEFLLSQRRVLGHSTQCARTRTRISSRRRRTKLSDDGVA